MKRKLTFTSCLLTILSLTACSGSPKGATYKWKVDNIRYENFTDLGRYVIDVDTHTHFDFDRALAYSNARYDKWAKLPGGGCSALGTKTN
ncbi:MAG: hypothetical protein MJ213_02520 [Bacilli bacterium]|nr:hypothetical protein [Bacilli bacterium]